VKTPHTPSAHPCLTFALSLPSHSPSRSAAPNRSCFTVLPSLLDFCQCFGHSELHLSLAHRKPVVVSPFLNSSARFVLTLSPVQVGACRRRDSSTSGQTEPLASCQAATSVVSGQVTFFRPSFAPISLYHGRFRLTGVAPRRVAASSQRPSTASPPRARTQT
jgi:hypothetical protein